MRSFALKPRRLRRCPSVDARILRRVYLCPAPAGAQKRDQRRQERRQENVTKTDPETPPSIWCCLSFLSENTRSSSRSDQLPSLVEAPHLSRVERRIAFACREQRDVAIAIVFGVL